MTLVNTPKHLAKFALAVCVSCATAPAAFAASAGTHAEAGPEAAFLEENEIAMTKMMDGMDAKPSGDVDKDFVAMMIPHHQGAIDMAQAELRHGKNEQLRRIAQEIIVEQQQEIVAMRIALGQPLPPSAAAPDQMGPGHASGSAAQPTHHSMSGSMSNQEDQQ
ncbi:DUF305 domain-containing protein [Paraburkholderia phenoliruptrix]|uniref:DUF305 domain-containing protein n=1 Tax=Paraburkholderia phenoliruptrix TaxID=252970 RepID=UPI001C6EBE12|nr:DUF305 domain-containing protein [Paraburkholderia phenoliruptrix]MBW9104193.1 DUF305 domain-containing protein [Paraburkholderia phenoliruptrix]MBW9128411.1 DUF305 domain-containing protein [Paraburkholderia ginsengiterrae]